MATIAFLGLGNMGYPMAGHLANSGHQLRVFNRTQSKAQRRQPQHKMPMPLFCASAAMTMSASC